MRNIKFSSINAGQEKVVTVPHKEIYFSPERNILLSLNFVSMMHNAWQKLNVWKDSAKTWESDNLQTKNTKVKYTAKNLNMNVGLLIKIILQGHAIGCSF